jgi:membrane-bound serine protease (ClpP class)
MMLIRKIPNMEFLRISWGVIIPTVVVTVLFFLFVIGAGLRAQRSRPTTGVEGIIGETGGALDNLYPTGSVLVHGEIWTAEALMGNIEKGQKICVTGIENLRLKVKLVE